MNLANWEDLQTSTFIIALLVSLLAFFLAKKKGFFRSEIEEPFKPYLSFYRVLGAFVAYLLIQLLLFPLILFLLIVKGIVTQDKVLSMEGNVFTYLFMITIALSTLVIFLYLKKPGKLILLELSRPILNPISYGLLSIFLVLPIVKMVGSIVALIVFHLFHYIQPEQAIVRLLKLMMHHPIPFSIATLEIIFFIPFIEEVLFRGFLQRYVKQKGGKALSYLITAAIFSLFHFEYGLGVGNIELLISLFIVGLFLSHLKEKKQSLWAPIGLHVVFNAVSVLALIFGIDT